MRTVRRWNTILHFALILSVVESSSPRRFSLARLALRRWWHPSPAAGVSASPSATCDIHLIDAALTADDRGLLLTIPHRFPPAAQTKLERELAHLERCYGVTGVDLQLTEAVKPGLGPGWFTLRLPNLESARDYRALLARLEHALAAISLVVLAF